MDRVIRAFTSGNKDAVSYLNNLANPTYAMKNGIFVLQTVLGDGFVVSDTPIICLSDSNITHTYY